MLACNATPYPIVLDAKDNAAIHIIFQVIYNLLASLLDFEIKTIGFNNQLTSNENYKVLYSFINYHLRGCHYT